LNPPAADGAWARLRAGAIQGWLVWVLAGAACSVRGVELVSGPSVESLSSTSVVVRWVTDVASGTRVQWGKALSRLDLRVNGGVGREHEVTLTNLTPGVQYYYTVGTARSVLATNAFRASGLAGSSVAENSAGAGQTGTAAGRTWVPPPAPPARQTWGNYVTLDDHFNRHGGDFKAGTADEYAAMAWQFLQRAKVEGLPTKQDAEGVLRVFDPKTGAFGAYNRDGTTKTFFKPRSRDYFERQPGKTLKAKDLR